MRRNGIFAKIIAVAVVVHLSMALAIVLVHNLSYYREAKAAAAVGLYHMALESAADLPSQALGAAVELEALLVSEESDQSNFQARQQAYLDDVAELQGLLQRNPAATTILSGDVSAALSVLSESFNRFVQQGDSSWIGVDAWMEQFRSAQDKLLAQIETDYKSAKDSSDIVLASGYRDTLLAIAVITCASIAAAAWFVGGITRPLMRLLAGVAGVGEGKYELLGEGRTKDEVSELTGAFNTMVRAIQQKEQQLGERNEELHEQAKELTAQNVEIKAQQQELQESVAKLSAQEKLLGRLYGFVQSLNEAKDVDQLTQIALNGFLEEANLVTGAFLLHESTTNTYEVKASSGLADNLRQLASSADRSLLGEAVRQRKVLTAEWTETILHSGGLRGSYQAVHEIYVPVIALEEVLGVVALGRFDQQAFSAGDARVLAAMAEQLAPALHSVLAHVETEQALQRAQTAERLKSELVNTVSHELRTPLASILGFSELLLKKQLDKAKSEQYLGTIYREAGRLTDLINDFLDLQRIDTGNVDITPRVMELVPILRESVEVHLEQSKQHRLVLDTPESLPKVLADPSRVSQLLENLISNAIKYSPAGGEVRITAVRRGQEVLVSVQDEGLGIPADHLQLIFEPFYRVDNSDRRQIGGTGLGLAICKQIVQKLGGRIWVSSSQGQGSIFYFTLPVDTQAAAIAAPVSGERAAVVIIEDDQSLAALMQEALSGAGYDSLIVDNGAAALELIKRQPPLVIILDLVLPGPFDGWDVLRALKNSPATSDLPVIISSCLDGQNQVWSMGAADYLVKPFPLQRLVDSVRTLSSLRRGTVGLPTGDSQDSGALLRNALEQKGFAVQQVAAADQLLMVLLDTPPRQEGGCGNEADRE